VGGRIPYTRHASGQGEEKEETETMSENGHITTIDWTTQTVLFRYRRPGTSGVVGEAMRKVVVILGNQPHVVLRALKQHSSKCVKSSQCNKSVAP
jgi:hypothetical protein